MVKRVRNKVTGGVFMFTEALAAEEHMEVFDDEVAAPAEEEVQVTTTLEKRTRKTKGE